MADYFTMYKKLAGLDAAGAIERDAPERELVQLGFQMFENFRRGRTLQRVPSGPLVPWLLKKNSGTKFYHEHTFVHPPFQDHGRDFLDRTTMQRVCTIQPYFMAVADKTGVEVPQEFIDHFNDVHNNKVRKHEFSPLPQTPVVQDTVAAVLGAAQRKSDEFAEQYGLQAKVSFDGWYNPERVVLIEYTKRTA
jgi:hypothetical protein